MMDKALAERQNAMKFRSTISLLHHFPMKINPFYEPQQGFRRNTRPNR